MIICSLKSEVGNHINKDLLLGKTIGLVPTMGSLHKGHLSLIESAIKMCDKVWVSIFVNPTQFNNKSDLKKYPYDLKKDIELIKNISEKIYVFAPKTKEMYEDEIKHKNYDFQGVDSELEGKYRKNHFNGVGTIVSKLFFLFKPTKAFFGEKDFQQTQVIQKLIEIENHKTQLVICPTVREKNGLAMSSRNSLLSDELKEKASIIYETLLHLKNNFKTQEFNALINECVNKIDSNNCFKTEYFEIVNSNSLKKLNSFSEKNSHRAFVSVLVDNVRLIDNILLN